MIVIPMVGRSKRFYDAGYTVPKYRLEISGESVFSLAVKSFERYFDTEHFVFLVRADHSSGEFVHREVTRLGVKDFRIVEFSEDTRGQAETVYLGLQGIDFDGPLYIFNIDTFRPGFTKPALAEHCDGYLEVFRGDGDHWSFVSPGAANTVVRTTEKDRISDLCSDGLYYFRKKSIFMAACKGAIEADETVRGEFYIAPLYNSLIQQGKDIRYVCIERNQIVFCGTPAEYHEILISDSQS